jgi:hypothetical protein
VLAFYVDESGSFDLFNASQFWVVLLGIGFDDDHWLTIDNAVTDLKRRYFPHHPPHEVEIRSNDIRMAHVHPHDKNPFSRLSSEALRAFGSDLFETIDALPFSWAACAIHKPAVASSLGLSGVRDVYALAYVTLVDRLNRWCALDRKPGRLFIDQRDRDLHGKAENIALHGRHRDKSMPTNGPRVVERPYFHESARSNHIQLADIIAYNVQRRFRGNDSSYPHFVRILPKLRGHHDLAGSNEGLVVYGFTRP